MAAKVAENFLHTRMRAASDSRRMDIVGRYGVTDSRLVTALTIMESHIEHLLSLEAIAIRAGLSPRQLERLFRAAFKTTPVRFYLELRLKQAQSLVQDTNASLSEIALRCGFTSSSHLGQSYRQKFGATPGTARKSKADAAAQESRILMSKS
ncbi:MAG: helix-turn-helix domain-containing protein [Hyphomicrobiaceae bacterium]